MDQILFSLFLSLILFTSCRGIEGTTFTLINKCGYTIWPGILANAGTSELASTGFELRSGGSQSFQAPSGWSGRFWARTRCNFDPTSGQGSCATGDCGSGKVQCNGAGAIPPATLAEFTIGSGSSSQDYYDVSLVDGYNIAMVVDASGGSGSCFSTGCVANVNQQCPAELKVGDGDACKSACGAFGTPQYCCSGAYSSPATCQPSVYSQMFKSLCPRSYSYAYDDATSTFTCTGADYTITFCPTLTSQKSSTNIPSPTNSSTTSEAGTESVPTSGSGSGAGNSTVIVTGGGGAWLSNFISSGNSLTTYSNFGQQQVLTLIASGASFVLLQYLLCL
ncbi:Thaumatin-like protein 1 [Ancistrocladus abbreviatus]